VTKPNTCDRCDKEAETPAAMFCDACWQTILQQNRDREWRDLARSRPDKGGVMLGFYRFR
jgi:hypothetical protein